VAVTGLVGSYLIAIRTTVPAWELALTEWLNGAPAGVATWLQPVMQLGTVAGPLAVAVGIGVVRRDWWLAGATMMAGLVAWLVANGLKVTVERGRPGAYSRVIVVREHGADGFGYVSGHSAVAASAMVMLMVALRPAWRPAAAAVAGVVGVARLVHGVHLPADVVGGWCVGVLLALGALALLDLLERHAP
jgi:undecaprenyl-diphosphatase